MEERTMYHLVRFSPHSFFRASLYSVDVMSVHCYIATQPTVALIIHGQTLLPDPKF